jgi:Zn-finger nucleic acid-binding protein
VPDDAMDFVTGAMGMANAKREKTLSCTKCESDLEKCEYSFTSQIMIDKCPKGHGMWLDKGELSRLEKFYEEEQDFADFDEAEILKAMKGSGIKGFFAKLLSQ